MADAFDRLITLGLGLEKKARESLEEIEKAGQKDREEKAEAAGETAEPSAEEEDGEELSSKQKIENKLVDGGIKALTEFINAVTDCKGRLDQEISSGSQKVAGKLNIASREEVEIIMEMARVAREKVDALEKRIEALEEKSKGS